MKLTKVEKATLIMFAVVALFDIGCCIYCIATNNKLGLYLNGIWTINVIAVGLIYYDQIKVKKQRDELKAKCEELQEFKDNDDRYRNIQYDLDNTHGYYLIEDMTTGYWVIKNSPDCCVFIVKIFNYDPADETAKAAAKSKAEELLNLITEGGTLWQ